MPSGRYVDIITSSKTASLDVDFYQIDASNNSITFTLPSIISPGIQYNLKRIDMVSTNTVTIVTSSNGETIDNQSSMTLGTNGSVELISTNNGWATTGGNVNSIIGAQSEYNFSFGSGSTPRVIIFNTTSQLIQYFIYRGSNFYTSNPVIMTIAFSLNSGTADLPFSVTLTNTANSQQIAQINATATTSSTTLLLASTKTFTNVPTDQSLIQISGNLNNSSSTSIQLYCMYIQFA